MAGEKKKLNAKQRRFVEEYLIDLNATAAAERAGYKSPNTQGPRLLVNVCIQEAIQEGIKARADARNLTVDRIWDEWAAIGLSDIGDIIDFSGIDPALKPANAISERARRAIASIKVKRYVEGKDEDARTVEILEFKLWDKPGVLRDAAKARELFKDRLEVSGPGGKPVEIIEIVRPKAKDDSSSSASL